MATFPDVIAGLRSDGVTAGLTNEKVLFVGSMLAGSAVSGELQSNILADKAEDTLFLPDSPLANVIRRGRLVNGVTQFDAIGLVDNGAGAAATATVVFAGPATEAGTRNVSVGSEKYHNYTLAITNTMTATAMGDLLVTAITADANVLVTAANVTGTVTLTAKTKGTFGNTIPLKTRGSVAGAGVTLTAFTGGATDPVLTGVFDVIGEERYQAIVWQFEQDLTTLTDHLDPKFNPATGVEDGRGFVSITDTHSNLLTAGNAENSQSLSINGDLLINDTDHRGPAIVDIPFAKVAEFASIRALRRTDDASIGRYVVARSSGDSFGGMHLNSKPYANTPLFNIDVPDVGDSFTNTEEKQLKAAGIWVAKANSARNTVICGEVVTAYKTDLAGNPDPTFGFLNYVDTSSACREYIVNNTRSKYVQYRATGGALTPKGDSSNEASVAAFVAELYSELGDNSLVMTGTGTVNGVDVDYDKLFKDNLTVSLDIASGKYTIGAKLYIVVQARIFVYDLATAFEA